MILKISVLLSTVLMILVNMLAVLLPLNNQSTAQISDSFKVFFVPAGYVFSIWGLIYSLMIIYSWYQLRYGKSSSEVLMKIAPAVILSNIANSVWIFLWHYNRPLWSLGVMLILLASLIYIYQIVQCYRSESGKFNNIVKTTFSVYLGWISVATIANATIALYVLKWNGFGISGEVWSSILILVATVLGLVAILRNKDFVYPAVLVWSIVGIFVKFQNIQIISLISIFAVLILLAVGIYKYFKLRGELSQ
jgi:hypothetical protein